MMEKTEKADPREWSPTGTEPVEPASDEWGKCGWCYRGPGIQLYGLVGDRNSEWLCWDCALEAVPGSTLLGGAEEYAYLMRTVGEDDPSTAESLRSLEEDAASWMEDRRGVGLPDHGGTPTVSLTDDPLSGYGSVLVGLDGPRTDGHGVGLSCPLGCCWTFRL
jgi:hypothetical protein